MRDIIYISANYIDFGVDLFNLDLNSDINEQVNRLVQNKEHQRNMFACDSMVEATRIAERMLTRDDEYNCAIITMYKYDFDELTQSESTVDYEIVGEIWAGEVGTEKLN